MAMQYNNNYTPRRPSGFYSCKYRSDLVPAPTEGREGLPLARAESPFFSSYIHYHPHGERLRRRDGADCVAEVSVDLPTLPPDG